MDFDQVNTLENHFNKHTQTLIKVLPQNDDQKAKVKVNNLILYMLNRHLLQIDQTLKNEKLLFPSKIHMVYHKEFKAQENIDTTDINISIDPLNVQVGFRELDNFKKFQDIMNKIAQDAAKALNPIATTTLAKEDGMDEEKLHQMQKPNSHRLEKPIEEKPEETPSDVPRMKDRKSKQYVFMNVIAKLESISFKLMGKLIVNFNLIFNLDDTGQQEYPLITFSIHDIYATVEQETGLDDPFAHILKICGISEHPFMKARAKLALKGDYYNIDIGSYEPLIEPWEITAIVYQKTLLSPMNVELVSRKMLNINLTYGMALGKYPYCI